MGSLAWWVSGFLDRRDKQSWRCQRERQCTPAAQPAHLSRLLDRSWPIHDVRRERLSPESWLSRGGGGSSDRHCSTDFPSTSHLANSSKISFAASLRAPSPSGGHSGPPWHPGEIVVTGGTVVGRTVTSGTATLGTMKVGLGASGSTGVTDSGGDGKGVTIGRGIAGARGIGVGANLNWACAGQLKATSVASQAKRMANDWPAPHLDTRI